MIEKIIFQGQRTPLAEDNLVIMSFDGGNLWGNVPLYLDEINHSPTGFEWGYRGSGPSQLAYAILRVYFELVEGLLPGSARNQARQFYFEFKDKIITCWKGNEWEITSDEISVWIGGEKAGWL